ncbi:MAG TPA: hypothetical protein VMS55_04955 [Myxococcota bacterium]|nr:hypothetical protein [Myxococcota bacterium]
MLALAGVPAHAQTVQSTVSYTLTVQVTMPTATGSQIATLRLGTREIIEGIKQDLGITASGGMLVLRRAIDDFDTSDSWLIVGSQEYLVPDTFEKIQVDLPPSFFAQAEADTGKSGTLVHTDALAGGDLQKDGFEATLTGVETRTRRLLAVKGVNIGYLVSSSATVIGGILVDVEGVGMVPGVITGTIRTGSEKLVSP